MSDVDLLLALFNALPESGTMRDIRKACPPDMTPHGLFTKLHRCGWLFGTHLGWRKTSLK